MEAEIFKNCSGFTDEEIKVVAGLRCGLASVSCLLLCVVFGVLMILAVLNQLKKVDIRRPKVIVKLLSLYDTRPKVCDNVAKCLLIWLIAVSALYELFLALGIVNHFNPGSEVFCKVDGFLNQYLGSVQLLFTLGIMFIMFSKIIYMLESNRRLRLFLGKEVLLWGEVLL